MGDGFEYEFQGPGKAWFGAQAPDGSTATAEPGETVAFAEPAHGADLVPSNDAAKSAAELLDESDPPLADRVGSMKVGELVPLLDALDPAELAEVRAAEEAGRGRTTVVARIDELLAAVPPDGGSVTSEEGA